MLNAAYIDRIASATLEIAFEKHGPLSEQLKSEIQAKTWKENGVGFTNLHDVAYLELTL